MIIEEAYVSFESAKLLKEHGFDVSCLSTYDINNGKQYFSTSYVISASRINAPTHQVAMAWLREKYYTHIDIIINGNGCCIEYRAYARPFKLVYPTRNYDSINSITIGSYNTYEEAVEAALKYALTNLI